MKGRPGAPGGMQNLMKQANQLQIKIKKLQEELAEKKYEGTAGGGAVTVEVKGEHTIIGLKIADDVFKSGDVEMLQDMILAAANDALKKARDSQSTEMEKITGGFNFPGM
jgi:nucleoid-associated protein EbfC